MVAVVCFLSAVCQAPKNIKDDTEEEKEEKGKKRGNKDGSTLKELRWLLHPMVAMNRDNIKRGHWDGWLTSCPAYSIFTQHQINTSNPPSSFRGSRIRYKKVLIVVLLLIIETSTNRNSVKPPQTPANVNKPLVISNIMFTLAPWASFVVDVWQSSLNVNANVTKDNLNH